jgi:hypothetical protein
VTFDIMLPLAAFHNGRGTDECAVRVLAEPASGTPLPRQIPALIEFDLNLCEARLLVIRQTHFVRRGAAPRGPGRQSFPEPIRLTCAAPCVTSPMHNVRCA